MIFLGVDCGTQSTKTIALDLESGAVLASAQKAYGFVPDLSRGAMEQEPKTWVEAADETIASVVGKLGDRRGEVGGIGISGQQHGLVVLDRQGEVVRPAKLWCDTSTEAQCAEITSHFGGVESVVGLVGNAMLAGYTAPKILWLIQNEPENWKRTRHILLPHDYLNYWLTGKARMEYGDASGTALLDVAARTWSEPMLNFIAPDLHERLPELGSSAQAAGELRPELAARWGLRSGVVIASGGGDNMMGAIGTGNVTPGLVSASLGTSGTLYAYSDKPVIDPRGEMAAYCDSTDAWLPLVCTMNVTRLTELARQMLEIDHGGFEAEVLKVKPGADGLTFLPYLCGERTPNLPNGSGVVYGLTDANFTRAHFARAAMEGATLGLGYGLRRLRELGVTPTEIRLTGGGSNSAAWRQICADVFEVPVVGLKSGEGAALGGAIQAAWNAGSGAREDLIALTDRLIELDESTRVTPQPEAVEVYRASLVRMDGYRETLLGAGYL